MTDQTETGDTVTAPYLGLTRRRWTEAVRAGADAIVRLSPNSTAWAKSSAALTAAVPLLADDDQSARVPDLPCPKCGDADVRVRYCDGCKLRHNTSACSHGEREHFHRSCRRCGFDWKTDDVFDAKVVCAS